MASTRNTEGNIDGYEFEFFDRHKRNGRGALVVSLSGGRAFIGDNPTKGVGYLHESMENVGDLLARIKNAKWDERVRRGRAFLHLRGPRAVGNDVNEGFIRALHRVFKRPEVTATVTLNGDPRYNGNYCIPKDDTDGVIDEYVARIDARRDLDKLPEDTKKARSWYGRQARRGRCRFEFYLGHEKMCKRRVSKIRSEHNIPSEAISVVPIYGDRVNENPRAIALSSARQNGYRFFENRFIDPTEDDEDDAEEGDD